MTDGGARRSPVSVESVVAAAEERSGLVAPSSATYLEGLELIVAGLNDERLAPGRKRLVEESVRYLTNRLRVDDAHARQPSLAAQPVSAPVVILGLPRTGTTAVSYLFDCDPQWRSLLNWEAVESVPPPTTATLRTDPRCRAALDFQREVFPLIEPSPPHWEWADGPTECTFLVAQDFRSAMWDTRIPSPAYREFIENCDMVPAYRHHLRTLQVLQQNAPGRWVLKMPAHAYFIDGLLSVYPDAEIIWMHRDPYESVASFLDLAGFAQTLSMGTPDREWIGSVYPQRLAEYLSRASAALQSRRVHHVHYSDVVQQPLAVMAGIYRFLGLGLGEDVAAVMEAWLNRDPLRKSRRRPYSLGDWGLERADLEPFFGPYAQWVLSQEPLRPGALE